MDEDRGRGAGALLHRDASGSRRAGPWIAALSLALPWLGCTLAGGLDDLTDGDGVAVADGEDAGKKPGKTDGGSSSVDGDDAGTDTDTPDDASSSDDGGTVPGPPADAGKIWLDLEETTDFGNVDCGKSAAARTALLHNDRTSAVTFGATLASGAQSAFTVDPAYGTIEGGKTAVLVVQPKAVPKNGGVGVRSDLLTVTTNAPDDVPINRGLRYTATGAIVSVSPTSISFGNIDVGSSSSRSFSIKNTGNVDAKVSVSASGTSFSASGTSTVKAGKSASDSVVAKPTLEGYWTGTVSFSSSSPICGSLPSISLSCWGKKE